jgi:argininosuccinate lyase
MPHKKNPDVLELIRGKSGRVIGGLNQLLILVKALPLAYNRDLQEDKAVLFDAFDTVAGCLSVAAPMVRQTKLRRDVIASRIHDGFLDATTLMESLIAAGVPMRSAHEAVGKLVRRCEVDRCRLGDLPESAFDEACPGKGGSVKAGLGVASAIGAFKSVGSTAPAEVERQLAEWKQRLG